MVNLLTDAVIGSSELFSNRLAIELANNCLVESVGTSPSRYNSMAESNAEAMVDGRGDPGSLELLAADLCVWHALEPYCQV